jgi:hypothetical protein
MIIANAPIAPVTDVILREQVLRKKTLPLVTTVIRTNNAIFPMTLEGDICLSTIIGKNIPVFSIYGPYVSGYAFSILLSSSLEST